MGLPLSARRLDGILENTSDYLSGGIKKIKRDLEFAYTCDDRTVRTSGMSIISFSTFAGGAIGYSTGVELSKKVDKTNKYHFPWLGAGVGAIGGFGIGTWLYMKGIEARKDFNDWKTKKVHEFLSRNASDHYAEDPILRENICPITMAIPLTPANIPDSSQIFDYNALLSSAPRLVDVSQMSTAERSAVKIKHPLRADKNQITEAFYENDIVINYEKAVLINKRLRHLINRDLRQLGGVFPREEEAQEAVKVLDSAIQNFYREFFESIAQQMSEMGNAGDPQTVRNLSNRQVAFFDTYGETAAFDPPFFSRV